MRTVVSCLAGLLLAACGPAKVDVGFSVEFPSHAPPWSGVSIDFDGETADLALSLRDGTWSASAALPDGAGLTYRLRMAGPDARETDPRGETVLHAIEVTARATGTQRGHVVAAWRFDVPTVTFEVTTANPVAADDGLFVAGDATALGGGRADGVALRRGGDGAWRAWVGGVAAGTEVSWNVTRGTEVTRERDPVDGRAPVRRFTQGTADRVERARVERWGDEAIVADGITGTALVHAGFPSRFVRARNVTVWLPPGYDDAPQRRFPVLYMHDGQNLFDARTAFSGEWRVDETATDLITRGEVEPLVIVGVWNTSDRIADYTPVPDPDYGGGKAADYARFLVEELKPFIDATYRTQADASRTGTCGSSLGGLVSTWLGLVHPATFTRIGALSPSVWWSDRAIVDQVSALPSKTAARLRVDMGTRESDGAIGDARALRDALSARGWREGTDLYYEEIEGARHDEAAWSARFGEVLKWLYPAPP